MALNRVMDPVASRVIAAFTDLVLIVDMDGTIVDVSVGKGLEAHPGWHELVGRLWADALVQGSRGKLEPLLCEVAAGHTSRSREMSMKVEGLGEIPLRFTAALLDAHQVAAFGVSGVGYDPPHVPVARATAAAALAARGP